MPLTDMEIRTAKPGARIVKLSDGGGLQLWIMPDGAKRWRFAYRLAGVQKVLAIGVYPAIGLARRERRGKRPSGSWPRDKTPPRQKTRQGRESERVRQHIRHHGRRATGQEAARGEGRTMGKVEWLLSLACPAIGPRPIAEITAPEVLAVLRGVEARGRHETARRLRATIGEVFRFAVATGRAETDPTGALKGALTTPTVNIAPRSSSPRPSAGCSARSPAMRARRKRGQRSNCSP